MDTAGSTQSLKDVAPNASTKNLDRQLIFDPGHLIAGVVLSSLAALFLCSLITDLPFTLLQRYPLGLDFGDFYRAAERYVSGTPLYVDLRYVTPPTAAILFAPLTFLSLRSATLLFLVVNLVVVCLGLVIIKRNSGCSWLLVPGALLSYPVLFLLERGNVDGLVFLLVAFTLVGWGRRDTWIGVTLMMASLLKVYPLLLFIPAAIERRWRLLGAAALFALPWILLCPGDWYQFVTSRLFKRSLFFDFQENVSLTNGLFFLREVVIKATGGDWVADLSVGISASYAKPLWFVSLILSSASFVVIRRDRSVVSNRDWGLLSILFVLPMFLYPAQVYQYSQILVFLVLIATWKGCVSGELGVERAWSANIVLALMALSLTHNQGFVAASGVRYAYGIVPLANLAIFSIVIFFVLGKLFRYLGSLRRSSDSSVASAS
jgi:hypothetical protein